MLLMKSMKLDKHHDLGKLGCLGASTGGANAWNGPGLHYPRARTQAQQRLLPTPGSELWPGLLVARYEFVSRSPLKLPVDAGLASLRKSDN